MGKRHRRIRARSATRQVAGAANEKPGLNTPIAQNGLPSLRSPEGPCPSRPNLSRPPDDTDAFKEAVSCRELRQSPAVLSGLSDLPRSESAARRHVRRTRWRGCGWDDMRSGEVAGWALWARIEYAEAGRARRGDAAASPRSARGHGRRRPCERSQRVRGRAPAGRGRRRGRACAGRCCPSEWRRTSSGSGCRGDR